ncbi:sperm receptor for egg jelly-like [Saccostrea echinata]|uniref:sperm receptor for egg jelly-like n=1 Tax=Saccostrea echinata TaxID=191078 RepID=UPI002A83F366|nr:sperm receptor for egg jelly-like [Saccostrea echinata]
MKSDEALISPLYLSEGQKEDNYTQRLTVKCLDSQGLMSATPITVQVNPVIGCLSNCEDKAVPGQTLLLQSLCDSCRSHTWTVYGCGTQCDVLIGPPQNGSNFSISVNESFEQQQIFYTGTSLSGRNMTVQYNLTVNLPPTQGNCTITPQSGYSLVTAFNVSCRGFTDPDLPLSYVIYQRQSSGKETELMKSDEALISPLYLSEGPKEDNYTQRLAVKCMDSRGLMSATPITVQIQPLERNPDESLDAIDVISESVLGNSTSTGILHDLLAAGKQSGHIRGALVAVLVNSSTGPPESININAITSVLNTATEVQEELSEETQVGDGDFF